MGQVSAVAKPPGTSDVTPSPETGAQPTIVLTTVSSDSHTWNLVYLERLLREWGARVINLGSTTPDELVEKTIEREHPDGVVVSTVNGHGRIDGVRLARRLRRRPMGKHLPMIIGGKLDTEGGSDATAKAMTEAGYDAVAQDSVEPLKRMLTRIRSTRALAAGSTETPRAEGTQEG